MNKESSFFDTEMEGATGPSLFRWETASGLEHTCYACPTKANHPKARQSCYGIHSIPCSRYHPTMHAIGTSHNCFACIQSENTHIQRHKKIAELLAEYRTLHEADDAASVKDKKGTHDTGLVLRERDANAPVRNRHGHIQGLDHQYEQDAGENDGIDISSVSNASTNNSKTSAKPTKAGLRAAKREAKSAKSKRKSLKNQNKHVIAVKSSDVEHVALVLHGEQNLEDSHPLASDKCIEDVMNRNRKYVKYIAEHKALLLREVDNTRRVEQEQRARKARKRKDRESISNNSGDSTSHHKASGMLMDEDEEAVVNAVLIRFDISVDAASDGGMTPATPVTPKRPIGGSRAGSQQKAMVLAQLRMAIAEDLQKHENEQRQTCIRAGGFWRYVGRPVFDRMMEISERIDWRTGAVKKPEARPADTDNGNVAADADQAVIDGAAADEVQEWVEDVVDDISR